MKRGPLKIFYSYAHEDQALRDRIDEHLALLRRQDLVIGWHDRQILPGTEWHDVIGEKLASSDIVLLLVSRAFMDSAYINEVEIPVAIKAHDAGTVRVVPILLERDSGWETSPFARLQALPSEAVPIAAWNDPVEALHDIVLGIRNVARDIIIAGGGPFAFGPHEFSEAELAILPRIERERTAAGLKRLHDDLTRTIPPRRYESNLLVATWALRHFGRSRAQGLIETETLFYMAQVITAFDLVALQEVDRNLQRLESLVEVLGPDWNVLVTDVAPGIRGNRERFAFLYYRPRVEFRNFSSQVILPPEPAHGTTSTPVRQFARPPLVAAFRSGAMAFQACTAHIVYGGTGQEAAEARLDEIRKLGRYLNARSRYDDTDLLLLGDFQMEKRDSPVLDILRQSKVQVPDEVLHPTNLNKTRYYDLIGFTSPKRSMPLGSSRPRSGVYDLFQQVLRDADADTYLQADALRASAGRSPQGARAGKEPDSRRRYLTWKSSLISDHLPLWVELRVADDADGSTA